MSAIVTDQVTSSCPQPSAELAAALLRRGYECAESESGEIFVKRRAEPWKSTYWDDHNNLWIEYRYRTNGTPVPRLLVGWATLEGECAELATPDVDRDPAETQIRDEKNRTFEIIADYCEQTGAPLIKPTPRLLNRMPSDVAEAWRQHLALENRDGHDSVVSRRTTARRSAQRLVRRGPERRSANAAKRHASGTRRKSATSSSTDDPPLPDAASEVARGIRPHVEAPPSKLELAYEVYRRELAEGCRRTVDVYEAMLQAGVSITTAKRARKGIGLNRRRIDFGPGGWFEIEMPPAGRWSFDAYVGSRHVETWSDWGESEDEAYARHCAAVRSYKRDAGLPTLEDVGRALRAMAVAS